MGSCNVGDLIIYGTTGVCRVDGITEQNVPGTNEKKPYYVLTPVVRGGVIYTPIESKLILRNAIDRAEAERILDLVPSIRPEVLDGMSVQQLTECYTALVATHKLEDLALLAMSIYRRKVTPEKQRCKYGRVDVKYMKLAEELLCGELSVALGLGYEEMRAKFGKRASMAGDPTQ